MKRIVIEYQLKTSPAVLFSRLSTPSGLAEWFSDNVKADGKKYTFYWGKSEQSALLLSMIQMESIRFKWIENPDDIDFELKIVKGEIIEDISLIVSDYAEEGEEEDLRQWWNAAITRLKKATGS